MKANHFHPVKSRGLAVRRLLATTSARLLLITGTVGAAVALATACGGDSDNNTEAGPDQAALVAQGKDIFRFDTFGDETQWTDTLRMHEVIRTAVDPTMAISVGLKVDAEALPPAVVQGIQDKTISLTDPATTVALIKLNAVVGVKGTVGDGQWQRHADAGRRDLRPVPFDR